jgi:GDPmannose 4,6-dehydratase
MKTAFITGITGQDGSYLSELLLEKEYQVVGLISKEHGIGSDNIKHIQSQLVLEEGDLLDPDSLKRIFKKHQPDELYNLGAVSFIPASWDSPTKTIDVNTLGLTRLLEIIKDFSPATKIYQASSAKIFGDPDESPQTLQTRIAPKDPYGVSKAAGHFLVEQMRQKFGMFAVSGIMYNHESERRGEQFVTRKITRGAVKIKLGLKEELGLGNLEAKVDWGYAPDFVKGMWLALQQEKAADYIFATGKLHTVKEICEKAFSLVDLDWKEYVKVDKRFYRKQTGRLLTADISRTTEKIGWKPETSLQAMIQKMINKDLNELQEEK